MASPVREGGELAVVKASRLPFEELPNLPKAVIPHIDLGISREDVLAIKPVTLASKRRVGYFVSDRSSQTTSSELLEVKRVTSIIETLTQDVAVLQRDLNFAHHVMKQDYESRLNDRATELYCRVNERLGELEKHHKEKVEIVRRSYRTQLNNAIQKIAGEYKAYYDELMQGKTGRHDLKIKELKERLSLQEAELQEQSQAAESLQLKLQRYEEELGERAGNETPPPPTTPPGLSLEEGAELQATIEQLEGEVSGVRAELAAKEEAERRLGRQVDSLSRQLEEERGRVAQLKRDLEALKKKTKTDQERTQRMAENQLASMQKEMKENMETAQKDASRKAEEQSEMQRMRDQAKFQEELARRQANEDRLRSEQVHVVEEKPPAEGDVYAQLEQLQKTEARQRSEINRLGKELERSNRTWEMKLAVMQRNFHALRDECFLRHSLQRQSATLHHATVGYAVSGHPTTGRKLKPLPQIQSRNDSGNGFLTNGSAAPSSLSSSAMATPSKLLLLPASTADELPAPPAPSPSPLHSARELQPSPARSVRFTEGDSQSPLLLLLLHSDSAPSTGASQATS